MPGFGRKVGGSLANQFSAGKVYNPYTREFAPGGVTGVRMGLGAAGQVGGPIGGIAGMLGNWLYTRNNPQAQAFDAGIRGWKGITDQFGETSQGISDYLHNQPLNLSLTPQVSYGGQLASSYTPSVPTMPQVTATDNAGSWQGLNPFQQGRGLNYATASASAPQMSGGGARGMFSKGGITGDAARAMFAGMSDASRFNTSMGYEDSIIRQS